MKCSKCGAELSTDIEIRNGICENCVSAQLKNDDTFSEEGAAPRKQFVLSVLNILGGIIIVISCIAVVLLLIAWGLGDAPGNYIIWLIVAIVGGVLSGCLLLAVSEILNALYDIRDKL